MVFEEIEGGICAPGGFLAGSARGGIKAGSTKDDVAVIVSERPCAAAGAFTRNKFPAAPVVLTRKRMASGRLRAVVVNSGNANACTGDGGYRDAEAMAALAASLNGLAPEEVGVASTGVIGIPLPMEAVERGIRQASSRLSSDGSPAAARAIMTTDTFPKEHAISLGRYSLGGIAKGSGMIHPDMATMLAFITTDAEVDVKTLAGATFAAVDASFNRITVDGDTSTNDMVIVLANGASGVKVRPGTPEAAEFATGLGEICRLLAVDIARDGEGATKLLEVRVTGAASEREAAAAARTIAGSNLVKAALFGNDANWGRVIMALGNSPAGFEPARVSLRIGGLLVFEGGTPTDYSEKEATAEIEKKEVRFTVDLGAGSHEATAWGCDLTYDYVKINGSYRT